MPPVVSLCSCDSTSRTVLYLRRISEEKKMCHNFPGDWCPQIFPGGWPKIWLLFWEPPAAHQNSKTIVFSGTKTQIHKYKPPAAQQDCCTIVFSGTQIQIHNYKYKNTTHKYTNTNHQLPTKTVAQLSSQGHKGAKCHLLPSFLISLRVLDRRRIQRSKISQSCRCKLANPQMCNVLTKNEKGKMSTKNYPAKLLLL